MAIKVCGRCGSKVTSMQALDINLKSKLSEAGITETLPNEVCMNCFATLKGQLTATKTANRERAKEENRTMLWKSRVPLVKKGRQCMTTKIYSEAAVSFEKYIRVIEIVFDVKPGELKPELFKDNAQVGELTVVASVFWDLLRVYDTHDKYRSRQDEAAEKLALFIRFTPIFADIVKKAESMVKSARNPAAFKSFLRSTQATRPRCFIATAAYDNPWDPDILFLVHYRDTHLMTTWSGRLFVAIYYLFSPGVAKVIEFVPALKPRVRGIIQRIVAKLAG